MLYVTRKKSIGISGVVALEEAMDLSVRQTTQRMNEFTGTAVSCLIYYIYVLYMELLIKPEI
jgi:hypothetical protein